MTEYVKMLRNIQEERIDQNRVIKIHMLNTYCKQHPFNTLSGIYKLGYCISYLLIENTDEILTSKCINSYIDMFNYIEKSMGRLDLERIRSSLQTLFHVNNDLYNIRCMVVNKDAAISLLLDQVINEMMWIEEE